jgi:hypothetical protein
MVNECSMVITKGINKGKLCKDIHKWCKHKSLRCAACKRAFRYQHTFDTHHCNERNAAVTNSKIKINVRQKPRETIDMYRVEQPRNRDPSHIYEQHQTETRQLKQIVDKLRGEIDEIRNQPKVQINNLTVITDDIFSKIAGQMGQDGAVKFLLDSLTDETECLDIVDKVYLSSSDKDQYPIACRDKNHFRFLGPNCKIVDDVGGDLIVSKIANSVQNAYLRASANLMEGHVNGMGGEDMYHMYDMRSVQNKIKMLPTTDNKERLREGLAIKVTNPTHPFFND